MEQVKKIVLYAAMGVICLLLWQSWMQDQSQQTNKASSQQASAKYKTPPSKQTEKQKPSTQKQPPSARAVAAKAQKTDIGSHIAAKDKWIHVQTDKLDVSIDPSGGHIVQSKLRQYYQTMDKKKPVTLLSPQNANYYVANDGLMDSQTQKTVQLKFHSDQQSYRLQPGNDQLKVTLKGETKQGLKVYKTFKFHRNDYKVIVS